MKNKQVIVKRINELYHDVTGDTYDKVYSFMIENEKKRWHRIANLYLKFDHRIQILDIGTGSGLVPLSICKLLKPEDTFICSDISRKMLQVADQNIKREKFINKFKFVKISSAEQENIPFSDNYIDIITMNSVLHHINNTNMFLNEVDRILKPNGLIFIGHEPNRYFYENKFIVNLSNLFYYIFYDYVLSSEKVMVGELRQA
jgi:demethylmenaquinone methyltransferase/2-methoxy-6-polyprenyl-1,4-benzoquinol methylase